jgi:hypothetical protein
MAPALPVIAGKPAPTKMLANCRSRLACDAATAVDGTGLAGDRWQASAYKNARQL